ncbi:unnamed protein product [Dovyalis caffra]|uniref:NAC domain-containing protein n=1 Tax=Dovyalis caffra TaxID=77055 RepID=A0AAV1R3W8_9ROSI|nr:unnamed protein product [Dovyalis caffra]
MRGFDMEKFNFVRDGMIRLPPGFRFQPTDEELVFQYLQRKILSSPLPASVIPEVNVCKYDPWELPEIFASIGQMGYEIVFDSFSSSSSSYSSSSSIPEISSNEEDHEQSSSRNFF